MPKLFLMMIAFFLSSLGSSLSLKSQQCPTIQMLDIYSTPGFPQIDELVVCGVPDTLSLLVINNAGIELTDVDLTVALPAGIQYAGWASQLDANFPVSNVNFSDLQNPVIEIANLSADELQVFYVLVEGTCAAINQPTTSTYLMDFDIAYEYVDNAGLTLNCNNSFTPLFGYSAAIKKPVLAILDLEPATVSFNDDAPQCQSFSVFQTGLNASLDNFNLNILGVDFGLDYNIVSYEIAGASVPYNYNPSTQILSSVIDNSFFTTGLLVEDDSVKVDICYEIMNGCETASPVYFEYEVSYGCDNKICGTPTSKDAVLEYLPDFGADPLVSVNPIQYPQICGDNSLFEISLTSAQTDFDKGVFENLVVGFQLCQSDALEAVDVKINGTSLNPSMYYYNNFDLVVDFTGLTTDIDGDGVGLEDYDGDTFFDDLPGGYTLDIVIEVAVKCQDISDINGCAALDCSFQTVVVSGDRHCGQAFQLLPTLSPPVDFFYGALQTTTTETNIGTASVPVGGYDFGTGNDGALNTIDIEFCYEFDYENISPCSNSSSYFQMDINGYLPIVKDIAPNTANATWAGAPVAANLISQTFNADSSRTYIKMDIGNDNLNTLQCYTMTLELDDCVCYPVNYVVANARVVEECNEPGCSCTIVRACEEMFFASKRTCDCVCVISDNVVELRRTSYGYGDRAMTMPLDETTANVDDLNRYLPCDSVYIHVEYEIQDEVAFRDMNRIGFRIDAQALGHWNNNPGLELLPSMTNAVIDEFSFEKATIPGVRNDIEFNNLDCISGSGAIVRPTVNGLPTFDHDSYYASLNAHVWNGVYDQTDNTRMDIDIRDEAYITNSTGDCVTEFINMLDPKNGDKFHIIARIPLQKNPYRHVNADIAAKPLETLSFRGIVYAYKTAGGKNSYAYGSCGTRVPVETFCPGEIVAKTNLSIDECTATVEHSFVLNKNTPPDWYVNEYRPFLYFDSVQAPLISPLVYAGNAQITDYLGNVTPINDPTFDPANSFCAFYNGTNYCTGTGGQTFGNFDASQFPPLGVGMPSVQKDSVVLTYDLTRVCPGPIEEPELFQLRYQYRYPCDFDYRGHICNYSNGNPASAGANYSFFYDNQTYPVDGCLGDGSDAASTNHLFTDIRPHHFADTSYTLNFTSTGTTLPDLTASLLTNLTADLANAPEPNTYTVCSGSGVGDQQNLITSIKVPPPVLLQSLVDDNGNAIPFTESLNDPTGTTYLVIMADLPPDSCVNLHVETELTFCPVGLEVETDVCFKTVSACLESALAAQLLASGELDCNSAEACFQYVSDKAEIQADWTNFPGDHIPMCTTESYELVVKNVEQALLTGLDFNFILPPGLNFVPGSFEASYPGGSNFFGPWLSIADPDSSGVNVLGTVFSMPDDSVSAYIAANGLSGFGTPGDSNKVSIRFDVMTECNEFISGSFLYFEATANDPCEATISSDYAQSGQYIVQDADPADFAQFTMLADPLEYPCDGINIPVNISGVNLSITGGISNNTQVCLIIPPELFYTPASLTFTSPATFTPSFVTETDLGGGLIEVCAEVPDGIGQNGLFGVQVLLNPDTQAPCGDLTIGAKVTSFLEDMECPGEDELCGVFVDNTVNNLIPISLVPPIVVDKMYFNVECDEDPQNSTYNYTVKMYGIGGGYVGNLNVEFYQDIDLNGQYDSYDPLIVTDVITADVPAGTYQDLSGSVTMPENISCPVIVKMELEVACLCSELFYYLNDAPTPDFLVGLEDPTVLCPGASYDFSACTGYDFELSPAAGGTITQIGNLVTIDLNDGYGVNSPVTLEVTGQQAGCPGFFTAEFLRLEELDFGYYSNQAACVNICENLELGLPFEWADQAAVTWTPATYLDDPSSQTPEFCPSAPGDVEYIVTVQLPDGCELSDTVVVNVQPLPVIEIEAPSHICPDPALTEITATAGFDYYIWNEMDPITGQVLNTYTTNVPSLNIGDAGTYLVEGHFNGVGNCPGISTEVVIEDVLTEIELTGGPYICPDPGSVQLDATPGFDYYTWSLTDFITGELTTGNTIDPFINPNQEGLYSVSGHYIDAPDCPVVSPTLFIEEVFMPFIDTGDDNLLCFGDEMQLSLNTGDEITNIVPISGDLTALPSCTDCNNPTISPNQTTTYEVTVTSPEGCVITEELTVTVNDLPLPIIEAIGETTICELDAPVTMSILGTGFPEINWYLNGITLVGTGNTYDATVSGAYTVSVIDVNGCAANSNNVIVEIEELPAAGNDNLLLQLCEDDYAGPVLINLNDALDSDVSGGQWSAVGNTISFDATSGIFDGTGLTVNDAYDFVYVVPGESLCPSDTAEFRVTIIDCSEPCTLPGIEVNSTDVYCEADSAQVCVTQTFMTYEWYLAGMDPDVDAPLSTERCYSPSPGAYQFFALVDRGEDCENVTPVAEINIAPAPEFDFELMVNGPACAPESVSIVVAPDDFVLYNFYLNGILVQSGTPNVYEATSTGNYMVEVVDENGCSAFSDPTLVNVFESPDIELLLEGNGTYCPDSPMIITATPGYDQYEWFELGNPIALQTGTSNTYTSLTAGSFYVTVTDLITGCSTESEPVALSILPIPSPEINAVDGLMICPDETCVNLSISGDYNTFQWYLNTGGGFVPVSGATLPVLEACEIGSYTVSMQNDFNCIGFSDTVNVEGFTIVEPQILVEGSNEVCADDTPINLSISGGPFSNVEWYLNGITVVGTGSTYAAYESGFYSVQVSDQNACASISDEIEIIINENPEPELMAAGNGTFCEGFNIDLTATAGFSSYEFSLIGTGIVQTGLSNVYTAMQSGDYTVSVIDAQGCTGISAIVNVMVDPLPNPEIEGIPSGPLCYGECVELYTIGNYQSIVWYQGDPSDLTNATTIGAGNSIELCEAGTYFVQVVDEAEGQNCEGISAPVEVFINEEIEIEINSDEMMICEADAPATLEATEIPGATYNWYLDGVTLVQSGTSNIFDATKGASYTVEVITEDGCSAISDGITIMIMPMPIVDAGANEDICLGESLELSIVTNGIISNILPISGDLNALPSCTDCNNPTVSPTITTVYEVTVESVEACISIDLVTVMVNELPKSSISLLGDNETCAGNAPVTLWSTSLVNDNVEWYLNGITLVGTGNTFDAYESGIYSAVVTDDNACSGISEPIEIIIHENPEPELTASGNGTFCSGGEIDLTASSGFPSYTFELIGTGFVQSGTSNVYAANASGDYVVSVIDVEGCFGSSDTISVTVDPLPEPNIEGVPSGNLCYEECANLYVVGAYQSVVWYMGDPNDLVNAIQIGAGNAVEVCESGFYFVYVIDEAEGQDCEAYSTEVEIAIEEELDLAIKLIGSPNVCEDELPVYMSTDTYQNAIYNWYLNGTDLLQSGTQSFFNAETEGTYTVQVISEVGCSVTSAGVSIAIGEIPFVDAGANQEICLGSSTVLSINSNAAVSMISVESGDFNAVPSCISCNEPIVSPEFTTSYLVEVTTADGCSSNASVLVTVIQAEQAEIDSQDLLCEEACPLLTTNTAGTFYEWFNVEGVLQQSGSSNQFQVCEAGDYYVVVYDGNNCASVASDLFNIQASPEPNLGFVSTPTNCEGGTVAITADAGYASYEWYYNFTLVAVGSDNVFEASNSGIYSVLVTDENGCSGESNDLVVGFTSNPIAGVEINNDQVLCEGDEIQICVTEIWSTYNWYETADPASSIAADRCITVTEDGSYYAIVSNDNDCEAETAETEISFHPYPAPQISLNGAAVLCEGETTELNVNFEAASSYQWYFNGFPISGATDISYIADTEGEYSVLATSEQGCETLADFISIEFNEALITNISLNNDNMICEDEEIELCLTSSFDSHQWFNEMGMIAGANDICFSPSISGSYYVEASSESYCSVSSIPVEITILDNPIVELNSETQEVCSPQTILITATTGFDQYTFYLNGNIVQAGFNNVYNAAQSGMYTVVAENENGCSATSNPLEILIAESPIAGLTITGDGNFCEGGNVEMIATDGYDLYDWYLVGSGLQQSGSSNLFTASEAGEYYVEINANSPCSTESALVEIFTNPVPEPIISVIGDPAICLGESVQLAITGNYTNIQWSMDNGNGMTPIPGANNTVYEATASGSYQVYLNDGNGCEGTSDAIDITIFEEVIVEINDSDMSICPADFPVEISATSGFANYTWYKNGVTIVQSGTEASLQIDAPGDYSVLATSQEGCTGSSTGISIEFLNEPVLDLIQVPADICYGDEIVFEAAPVNEGETIHWEITNQNPDAEDQAYIFLGVGPHAFASGSGQFNIAVEIYNTNGCSTSTMLEYEVESLPEVSLDSDGPLTLCEGEETTLTASGTGSISYNWYNNGILIFNENTSSITVGGSGTYAVESVSESGCLSYQDQIEIEVNELPDFELDIACQGTFCEGTSLEISVWPASYPSYTFINEATGEILQSGSSNEFEAIEAGSYYVVVSDGICSSQGDAIEIEVAPTPEPMILTIGDGPVCYGACQELIIQGNYQNVTWYQGDPADLASADLVGGGNSFEACESGNYFAQVYGENDCEGISEAMEIVVNENIDLQISAESLSICEADAPVVLTAEPANGSSYAWYNNGVVVQQGESPVLETNAGGIYFVEMQDDQDCEFISQSIQINILEQPLLEAGADQTMCFGNSATLDINTNGFILSISPINGDLSAMPDCICVNPQVSPNETTTYEVVVAGIGTCQTTDQITVNVENNFAAEIQSDNNSACEGGSIELTAYPEGQTSYTWSDQNGTVVQSGSNNVFVAQQSGIYTVEIEGVDDCLASANQAVSFSTSNEIVLDVLGGTQLCDGESVVLLASPGMTQYNWYFNYVLLEENNSATLNAEMDGFYFVEGIDENGCAAVSNEIEISIAAGLSPSLILSNDANICEGENLTICLHGVYASYNWYNTSDPNISLAATPCFSPTESGSYAAYVENETGCSGTSEEIEVVIGQLPELEIISDSDNIPCGGEANLTVSPFDPSATYEWYFNGALLIQDGQNMEALATSDAGLYYVIATYEGNCQTTSESILVEISENPEVNIIAQGNPVLCNGENLFMFANGGLFDTYQWYNQDGAIEGANGLSFYANETGSYYLEVSNNDCIGTSSPIDVIEAEEPTVEIVVEGESPFCPEEVVQLTASSGFAVYQWYNNGLAIEGANEAVYLTTGSGNYSVEVVSTEGCSFVSTASEIDFADPFSESLDLEGPTAICNGEPAQITATSGFDTYQWYVNGSLETSGSDNTFEIGLPGEISVVALLGNSECAYNFEPITLEYYDYPVPEIVLPNGSAICEGSSLQLLVETNFDSFQWYLDGNPIQGANSNSFDAVDPGTYSVEIQIDGGCTGTSAELEISLIENPEAIIETDSEMIMCDGDAIELLVSDEFTSYQWLLDGNPISGENGNSVLADQEGIYTVEVMNSTGCMWLAEEVEIDTADPQALVVFVPDLTINCDEESILLTVVGDYESVLWYELGIDEPVAEGPILAITEGGTCYAVVVDNNGCTITSEEFTIDFEECSTEADLELFKTATQDSVAVGDTITYNITVINNGPASATGVEIVDYIPEELEFLSLSTNVGNYVDGVWTIDEILAGTGGILELSFVVGEGASGTIINVAEVTASDQEDPNPDNNTDEEEVEVEEEQADPEIDLDLNKTVDVAVAEMGDVITYTISIINNGPDNATGVVANDQLSADLLFVSSNADAYNPQTGDWIVGDIATGETIEIEIVALVNIEEGQVANYATITESDQPDTNPDNDDDEVIVIVTDPGSCEDLTVAANVVCGDNGDFVLIVAVENENGLEEGYNLVDNLTGEILYNETGVKILGPFATGSGYSITVVDAANPDCSVNVDQSIVDCSTTEIELLSFEGEVQEKGNFLFWTTATEKDNDYFTLYQSTNGIDFEPIARIEGAGNSNVLIDYDFMDTEATAGISYYRLESTDFAGNASVSNIVVLERKRIEPGTIWPNPAVNFINYSFQAEESSIVLIKVYDVKGSLMFSKQVMAQQGQNQLKINIDHFSSGLYWLELNDNNQEVSRMKFMKN